MRTMLLIVIVILVTVSESNAGVIRQLVSCTDKKGDVDQGYDVSVVSFFGARVGVARQKQITFDATVRKMIDKQLIPLVTRRIMKPQRPNAQARGGSTIYSAKDPKDFELSVHHTAAPCENSHYPISATLTFRADNHSETDYSMCCDDFME